jgi:hypothetical protein
MLALRRGGMLVSMDDALCTLQYAVGRVEPCPGTGCPFWLADADGCVLAAAEGELQSRPGLAQHLLELRLELDRVRVGRDEPRARSLFYRLLNEEQAAEA